jgi:glycerol-3-phosphate dehydrogenase
MGEAVDCDILIVGGGINGTAIAREAALAGKRVILVEMGDLAQATSSASTKLMHGGLRYLEYYEFKLVSEALDERAVMLRTAPHLVWPLEFRLPHMPSMRPWPIVRIGLLLYDWFARHGSLPRSRQIRLHDPALKENGLRAFSYWDGWVDDARLVVANALDAQELGADIRTHTKLVSAKRESDSWTVTLEGAKGAQQVTATMVVNAGGPWVQSVLHDGLGVSSAHNTRLVRGSHIVVRRCFAGDHALFLQQPDGRVVFAIPYLDDLTLIGTTDAPTDSPEASRISDGEVDYLLNAANLYLVKPLGKADIVGDYAGIRPLVEDGTASASAVSRDYKLEVDRSGAPLLNVFGGKITTARYLAAEAIKRLGLTGGDTRQRALPGGDFTDFGAFLKDVLRQWPFLDERAARRLAHAYGTRITMVLGNAQSGADLGRDFGAGLSQAEVDYLIDHEWARSAEDIIWRRTKFGYRMNAEQVAELEVYVAGRCVLVAA